MPSIVDQTPDGNTEPRPCATSGCPEAATLIGTLRVDDEVFRDVAYCTECAGYMYREFEIQRPVGIEEMTEAGELRVRLQAVEHDLEHVVVERDRAEAAMRRVQALADEFDANINWREWGIGNRIRWALRGDA